MKKTTKFYVGIALAAQSLISFVMFLVHLKKNKSLAKTFLGLSVIGGLSSAYLLYTEYQLSLSEKAEADGCCDCDDCCCDCDDECCDCDEDCCCEEGLFEDDNCCNIELSVEEDAEAIEDDSEEDVSDAE